MHPFTDRPTESVTALGETGVIAAIRNWLGSASPRAPFGIGDDCAVVPAPKGRLLLTVDPVIYGQHFDDRVAPRAAGEKLFKRNLSDIAAMGGRPRAAVVALAFDGRVKTEWLAEFYRGLARIGRKYRVPLVGGDIAQLPGGIVATLTLLGEASGPRILTRSGAKSGDWIYVTGTLGGSLSGHHWRFAPRLAEGAWLAKQAQVRAMMDVSDGLAKDLPALMPRGTRPQLVAAAVPISAAARRAARSSGSSALSHALSDGEDYELLFVVSGYADVDAFERKWKRAFPSVRLSRLGQFVPRSARSAGDETVLDLAAYRGFEHLVGNAGGSAAAPREVARSLARP